MIYLPPVIVLTSQSSPCEPGEKAHGVGSATPDMAAV